MKPSSEKFIAEQNKRFEARSPKTFGMLKREESVENTGINPNRRVRK